MYFSGRRALVRRGNPSFSFLKGAQQQKKNEIATLVKTIRGRRNFAGLAITDYDEEIPKQVVIANGASAE